MIGADDSFFTYEYEKYFKILPQINNWGYDKNRIKNGVKVPEGFIYSSETNREWMNGDQLLQWLKNNQDKIGKI